MKYFIGACYKYGKTGHVERDCAEESLKVCYDCGFVGHIARDCPKQKERKKSSDGRKRYNCGETEQISMECLDAGESCYR